MSSELSSELNTTISLDINNERVNSEEVANEKPIKEDNSNLDVNDRSDVTQKLTNKDKFESAKIKLDIPKQAKTEIPNKLSSKFFEVGSVVQVLDNLKKNRYSNAVIKRYICDNLYTVEYIEQNIIEEGVHISRIRDYKKFSTGSMVEVVKLGTTEIVLGKILSCDKDDKNLYSIDFGDNSVEDYVHVDRISYPREMSINQWSKSNDDVTKKLLSKLRFNRELIRFYFYKTCKDEGYWSWALIILATFTSTITLGNNVTNEPFLYYFTIIKVLLTLLATCTTLIAAWIKKQGYIEKINTCDRYLQKINNVIEQIDGTLLKAPKDRMLYSEFKDKILPNVEILSTTPPISPPDQKYCQYQITVNYPELISPDGAYDNKLWPWFDSTQNNDPSRPENIITGFGEAVIRSYIADYKKQEKCNIFTCFGCSCTNPDTVVEKYYNYFGIDYDRKFKTIIYPNKDINLSNIEHIEKYEKTLNEFNRHPQKTYNVGDIIYLNNQFKSYAKQAYGGINFEPKDPIYAKVVYPKILENKMVYICTISSTEKDVRERLKNYKIGNRLVRENHIDFIRTSKLGNVDISMFEHMELEDIP